MISNILNNPKVHFTNGAVIAAVSIWAMISAVAMPIFPIIGVIFGAFLMLDGLYQLKRNEHRLFSFDQISQNPSKDPLLMQAKKLNINLPNAELADEIIKFDQNSCVSNINIVKINHVFPHVFNKNRFFGLIRSDQQSTQPIPSKLLELETRPSFRALIGAGYNDKEVDCIAAARAVLGSKEDADITALKKFSNSMYSLMQIFVSCDLKHYRIEAV